MYKDSDAREEDGAEARSNQRGDIPRGSDLGEVLLDQLHLTGVLDAMPTPIRALTIDCVVLTGNPRRVHTANHVAEPGMYKVINSHIGSVNSTQGVRLRILTLAKTMARTRVPGLSLKDEMENTPLRMVDVTSCPSAIAPTNSVIVAKQPT